jgi:pimeloyl-ACP methyl ester carboxylesterase
MGEPEQFSFKGWNGETVHGFVVKPAKFDPAKKYPVAFLIHGGPQGSFGNSWSYRWNPQVYANAGYAVVMVDFHGSTGYGQAFTDAISQHWGDRPLEDLQKGWAFATGKYGFLDKDRACALGGLVRRLHDQLDRRQLERALEVPGRTTTASSTPASWAIRPRSCGSASGKTAARPSTGRHDL